VHATPPAPAAQKKTPTEQPPAFVLFLLLSFFFYVNSSRPFASPFVCTPRFRLATAGRLSFTRPAVFASAATLAVVRLAPA